ncbi:MAG: phospholipase D-like domain-containing protein [Pelotomaculum sp.]|jgi:cardiolipin synthase
MGKTGPVYIGVMRVVIVAFAVLEEVLCIAAKSGIDVRIITPKISDHWFVHIVTQSNYGDLLEAGVRIYEYTPGYVHAKTIISDDDNAVAVSINLDYRSFYLHFENGVWICGAPVLADIKKDILDIIAKSEEIHLEEWKARPWHIKLAEPILRLFSPLF